ncbi:FeoA family protein [Crenobacter caeni]|uniref:Ferrous iron transport protein A n=1 Tax=Crenobacter caeni TaxID=2705474 RepID=A0A6B2KNU5_9NEIS|nr:FeoA family protein [Crenobacter caeni]NDV11844.1 ferrous iron transport protein A [Crenobacter caeni]
MTLDRLRAGTRGIVTRLDLDDDTLRRVAAFGLRPGQTVHLARRAAFGGPLMLEVGTTQFLLRGSLARHIEVDQRA